jgi:hypothetical protein
LRWRLAPATAIGMTGWFMTLLQLAEYAQKNIFSRVIFLFCERNMMFST